MGHPTRQLPHRLHLLRLSELILHLPALGDVGDHPGHAYRFPFLVPLRLGAGAKPEVGPVPVPKPHLQVEGGPVPQVGPFRAPHPRQVVRVQPGIEAVRGVRQFVVAVAHELLPARREVGLAGRHVQVPEPLARPPHRPRIALLALGEPGQVLGQPSVGAFQLGGPFAHQHLQGVALAPQGILGHLDPDHRLDLGHQLRLVDRLGEKGVGPGFQPLHPAGGVGLVGRHQDDRDVPGGRVQLQLAGRLKTVHDRHLQVEEDGVRLLAPGPADAVRAGLGGDQAGLGQEGLQEGLQRDEVVLVVVDRQKLHINLSTSAFNSSTSYGFDR